MTMNEATAAVTIQSFEMPKLKVFCQAGQGRNWGSQQAFV